MHGWGGAKKSTWHDRMQLAWLQRAVTRERGKRAFRISCLFRCIGGPGLVGEVGGLVGEVGCDGGYSRRALYRPIEASCIEAEEGRRQGEPWGPRRGLGSLPTLGHRVSSTGQSIAARGAVRYVATSLAGEVSAPCLVQLEGWRSWTQSSGRVWAPSYERHLGCQH